VARAKHAARVAPGSTSSDRSGISPLVPLGALSSIDVAELLVTIRARAAPAGNPGFIEKTPELSLLPPDAADADEQKPEHLGQS